MKPTLLVQGAGSGIGNNLIRSLREGGMNLRILGSNASAQCVARSTAEQSFLLPKASAPNYIEALNGLIQKHQIDLLIPNNDQEVWSVSKHRDQLNTRIFLPDHAAVETCHDKHKMSVRLREADVPTAPAFRLQKIEDLEKAFAALPKSEKYWVRPVWGSGSMGATWVRTATQAKHWIGLWVELRGLSVTDFHILPFLPGRDFAFQSIWKNGELVVAKLAERLAYYGGSKRLSGMSSTPSLARTVYHQPAIDTALKAVKAIADRPHGNFCLDMKEGTDGVVYVTECNIGRFFMITTIFDRTGKINMATTHVKCALELPFEKPAKALDIEEGQYLIRDLDTEPFLVSESELFKIGKLDTA